MHDRVNRCVQILYGLIAPISFDRVKNQLKTSKKYYYLCLL